MDRLEDIATRARLLPFHRAGQRYVSGDRLNWLFTAKTVNELQTIVTVDIPWLVAEVRRLEALVDAAYH